MNSLGAIACGAGLQDSLNPIVFMACAFFIAQGFWLASSPFKISWLRIVFVLFYALSFLEFSFGPAQSLVFRKEFFFDAKIIYFVSGAGAFILGVVFLKSWFLISRGSSDEEIRPFTANGPTALLMTIIPAVILSALAAIGPMNNYIMLLGNMSLLRGQWQAVMPLLSGYVIFNIWPLWFVWALLSIKGLRPSFLRIICASIFFTASSCLILVFK